MVAESDVILRGVGTLLALIRESPLHVLLLGVNGQPSRVPVEESADPANMLDKNPVTSVYLIHLLNFSIGMHRISGSGSGPISGQNLMKFR